MPLNPTSFYGYASGYWRDWSGDQFLSRPTEVFPVLISAEESRSLDPPTVVYVRGFYAFVSSELRDWSGMQVMAHATVDEGISFAGVFHHELRDERANFGLFTTSARILPDVHVMGSVGAGNGASYMPITQLDGELRVALPAWPFLQYGVGGGASWWSGERRQVYSSVAAIFHLPRGVSGEQRVHLSTLSQAGAGAHVNVRSTTTGMIGDRGKRQFQLRVAFGDAPLYEVGPVLPDSDRLFLDGSVGMRYWLAPSYGYIVNAEAGGQAGRYLRVGLDFAIFLEL